MKLDYVVRFRSIKLIRHFQLPLANSFSYVVSITISFYSKLLFCSRHFPRKIFVTELEHAILGLNERQSRISTNLKVYIPHCKYKSCTTE